MAPQAQDLPNKNFNQSPVYSMSYFAVNCQSRWNSHKQQIPQSLSDNLSLKVESPSLLCQEAKHLGLQHQDHDSSSTQSSSQPHPEVTVVGATNSQDQCISSESGGDGSYGKQVEGQMKPVFFTGHPNSVTNPSEIDFSQSINHVSYPYADPYCGGLFAAYGPQNITQPQMVGMAPARVALPLDLAEDGPIYVNAKQYHGILRRRQMRAKLEAQNKLVKNRRPYLHESRHQHALNRVRGSGGRFLSKKKLQQADPNPGGRQKGSEFEVDQSETGKYCGSTNSSFGITSVTNSDAIFRQPDCGFSTISPHLGVRAPVVR
ncbi:Nuclear transcription factor Y subunit A-3 like [Actinidia chinensis var. chinensis]|uniref:Nuclear transcription factor Y subunit n=1 Tax=Actinidia chinensis var. chinensis TaxID=1590841 RepID=A0A2R6Q554_ACTCC|nr:Nuclear transcription factor Y subunit A-3 like [Actinidia chinensis var. chinensis]